MRKGARPVSLSAPPAERLLPGRPGADPGRLQPSRQVLAGSAGPLAEAAAAAGLRAAHAGVLRAVSVLEGKEGREEEAALPRARARRGLTGCLHGPPPYLLLSLLLLLPLPLRVLLLFLFLLLVI